MSETIVWAALSACWLGVLTSISPCPLASNIAAISYIGNRVAHPRYVLVSGLLYTLGRALAYMTLSVFIITSVLAIPELSFFLQRQMSRLLGPILILTALFLIGVLTFRTSGRGVSASMQKRVDRWGIWGALLMGVLFALALCPVSAALFFGGLMPLAIERQSRLLLPAVYGFGTALPVVAFALLLAFGTRYVATVFDRMRQIERWARYATALVFLVIGLYYFFTYSI